MRLCSIASIFSNYYQCLSVSVVVSVFVSVLHLGGSCYALICNTQMKVYSFHCIVVVEICYSISGERVFLDSSTPILVANQIINAGASKSCMPNSVLRDSSFLMNFLTTSQILYFLFMEWACLWKFEIQIILLFFILVVCLNLICIPYQAFLGL